MLQGAFDRLVGRQVLQNEDIVALEEAFYSCDFGPETTEQILEEIQSSFKNKDGTKDGTPMECARRVLSSSLTGAEGKLDTVSSENPQTICLIGVNGSGKTTTCAKLGNLLKVKGHKVLLGACDTFRAAATEQLSSWSSRLGLELITGHHGADSASVAFDAQSSAQAKGSDYLILDTAGRLHVKDNLMDELKKLKRVLQKRDPAAPQHSWLVIDGSTGTNGLAQARVFHEKFGLTGLVVTKLDGTSKGGAIVSIYREMRLPIFFVGLGESADDLEPFSVDAYVDSLFPVMVEPDGQN